MTGRRRARGLTMSPGPVSGLVPSATVLLLACLVSAGCGSGGGDTADDVTDNAGSAGTGTPGAPSASPDSVASTAADQGGPGEQVGSVASSSTASTGSDLTVAAASTAPAPSQAPVRSPSAGQGDPMITFGVEGGFAARLRSLQISPDGDLVADISGRRSTGHLSKAQLTAIVAALDASGLFDGDHSYPPPSSGADLQRYEITYRGATVVAYDTTAPGALTGAVRLLTAALGAVT